jgi:predicted DCC family thiol-disulfide oxidoreductase YuxK
MPPLRIAIMTSPDFTLFYDGLCPLCTKEVAWLKRWNRHSRLGLQDIHATDFDPHAYGKTHGELMAEIHGVDAEGHVIKGMAAFRATYRAVGLGWLLAPTGWPVLKPLFDHIYVLFAKHRIRLGVYLGGSPCRDGQCKVG